MFGRRGNYSTLQDDNQLQAGHIDASARANAKSSHRIVLAILVTLCVVTLLAVILVPVIIVSTQDDEKKAIHPPGLQCPEATLDRVDCYPERDGANEGNCLARGCCWEETQPNTVPFCFFPNSYGYSVERVQDTSTGMLVDVNKSNSTLPYLKEVHKLRMEVFYETKYRIRVKISDPAQQRYEVPFPHTSPTDKAEDTLYSFKLAENKVGSYFSFNIVRQETNKTIFGSKTGLVFSDQFIQISSDLTSPYIYGIGEHVGRLSLDVNWNTISLFSRDQQPEGNYNVYGVHPFYVSMETGGLAHGMFLLNSNAMDYVLQPSPGVTIRTIGGILDMYFFLGPTPAEVVQQYTELVGRPYFPPYWALGFHLCRWGYRSANNTRAVVERMRELQIPQDTQWNDIDYMRDHLDFTVDQDNFAELAELVDDLHAYGQHYVMIVDPGIGSDEPPGTYPPFDEGVQRNVFIKNSTGDFLIGEVWPGNVTFPDFMNQTTIDWWTDMIRGFRDEIPFDGLWIDMNEPSDFYSGSRYGCPNSSLETPQYIPLHISERGELLRVKTICMTAVHSDKYLHYNVHSLYGHSEAIATRRALENALQKRTLVLSRSTYAGSGVHAGHWLGDNISKWPDLVRSIPGILDFSLFGVPLVGVDICGFAGNATDELCARWQQVGAFYPFSRNHNEFIAKAQDPTVWTNQTIEVIRDSLNIRYQLLPYLYTLFYLAHTKGDTVARPLFMEFPSDNATWTIDTQFLWGDSLLISPILTLGATTVNAYLPNSERWYDYNTMMEVTDKGNITLDAPIKVIPLHVRGGKILPQQQSNLTTTESRENPFFLLVALDHSRSASGLLFLDDGESLNTIQNGDYSLISYTANGTSLISEVMSSGYLPANSLLISDVTILGLDRSPSKVSLNGAELPDFDWDWNNVTMALQVDMSDTRNNMNQPFSLQWDF